jgi:hypothetical protein
MQPPLLKPPGHCGSASCFLEPASALPFVVLAAAVIDLFQSRAAANTRQLRRCRLRECAVKKGHGMHVRLCRVCVGARRCRRARRDIGRARARPPACCELVDKIAALVAVAVLRGPAQAPADRWRDRRRCYRGNRTEASRNAAGVRFGIRNIYIIKKTLLEITHLPTQSISPCVLAPTIQAVAGLVSLVIGSAKTAVFV